MPGQEYVNADTFERKILDQKLGLEADHSAWHNPKINSANPIAFIVSRPSIQIYS